MDAVIVLLILLFVLLAIGVPVGFAIGGATMISMFFFSDLNMVVNAQYCYSGIFSFTVMAIPYFMLAGTIMSTGGIARRIVDFASALIDFVTGALGCVSMLACMFFGALTGSGMATTSAIGGIIGIGLGIVMANVLTNVIAFALGTGNDGFVAVPTLGGIAVSFGVSVGVGILFGYLPANKAARLNPIDALRYD